MASVVKDRVRGSGLNSHKIISGSNIDGMVIFYGASITKEQGEKLQNTIEGLEQQGFIASNANEDGSYHAGDEALGASWEPGTYAQLGLKVSQLAYTCKEMGLTDQETEQITSAYGKQIDDKISKANSLVDALIKQVEVEKEKLHKMIEEKNGGINPYKINSRVSNTTGKSSVELNREFNSDIYEMFSKLDTSSKDKFQSSFQDALEKYHSYWRNRPIEIYTGTERENIQLEALIERFNKYLSF